MPPITLRPSRFLIFSQGGFVSLMLFLLPFAYSLAVTNWQSLSLSDVITYSLFWLLFLGLSGYLVFRFVIQSWYAKLSFDGSTIQFQTLGVSQTIPLKEIRDCAFLLEADVPVKRAVGDGLHFLLRNREEIIGWKIRCGWKKTETIKFETMVREHLMTQGIKHFPLRENIFSMTKRN